MLDMPHDLFKEELVNRLNNSKKNRTDILLKVAAIAKCSSTT